MSCCEATTTRRPTKRARQDRREVRHHATADVVFDRDEAEFLRAMDEFKRRTGKMFPTWTDCLGVLRGLGWSKELRWHDEPIEVSLAG